MSHFLSIRASLDCLRLLLFLRSFITLAVLQGVTNKPAIYSVRKIKSRAFYGTAEFLNFPKSGHLSLDFPVVQGNEIGI